MESIDKLRERCDFLDGNLCDECSKKLHLIADEIEAEIAANYLELPIGLDHEPIHVGDICEMNGERFEVRQLKTDGDCWWAVARIGECYLTWYCRHVKPRTLEDIVADAIQYGHNGITGDRIEGKVAEFCTEIRELLGGDAE